MLAVVFGAVGDAGLRFDVSDAMFSDGAIYDAGGKKVSSSCRQDAGMTSHSDGNATDTTNATAGNGKVPSASPMDMLSLDSRFRGNDGAVVVGGGGGVGDGAVVVGTVATVGGGVGDGAVAAVTMTNPDDETIATEGNAHKSSFPRKRESRTNHSAQPTEFNAVVVTGVTVSF